MSPDGPGGMRKLLDRKGPDGAAVDEGAKEKLVGKLVQLTSDGIVIAGSDLRMLSWNKATERIFGLSAEELAGRRLQGLWPAGERDNILERLQKGSSGGESGSGVMFDAKFKKKDGTEVHIEHTVTSWEIGGRRYFGAIMRDITEWELAKETLARSEAEYRSLVDNASFGIAVSDIGGRLTFVNPALCRMSGYTREELLGKQFADFLHPEDAGKVRELFQRSPKKTSSSSLLEFRILRKDDSVAYCWASPIQMRKGDLTVSFNAVIQDVTPLHQAEEALKESEEMFRNLAEQSPNMIFINVRGRVVYANRRCEEIMGYTRHEFLSPGFSFLNITAPEYQELAKAKFKSHLGGKDVEPYEYALVTRDGRKLDTILSPKLINYCGEPAILGTITDITERKRAEQAIRESERFLDGVFSSIQDGISVLDTELRILRVNPKMEKWYAHAMPLVGKKCYEAYHGRSKPCDVCPTLRTLANDRSEMDTIPKRGGPAWEITGWIDLYSHPLKDAATGQTKGVIEYVRDVSETKNAEKAMKATEEKYRLVSENIPVAVYSALPDELSTNVFISGRMKDLTSYSAEEFINDPQLWVNIIYPDDRQHVYERLQEHRRKKVPLDVEYRIITRDDTVKWIRDQAIPVLDRNGEIARIDGFMEDITEKKLAEEALRASEERYRRLFETAPEGVALLDLEGRIIDLNEAAATIHGIPREKALGRHFTEMGILYGEDLQRYLELFERLVNGEPLQPVEIRVRGERGDRWQEVFPAVIEKDGEIEALQVIMRDVTERKQSQREMMARLMVYELEDGNLYLAKESSPVLALEAFRDLLRAGYRGAVLSRTPQRKFKEDRRHLYEYRWLTERPAPEAMAPDLQRIEKWLEGLPRNMAVLVDQLDFLIVKNGLGRTLDFVHRVRDLAYVMGHVVLMSLDPAMVVPSDLHRFEKDALEIVPRSRPRLPEDVLEVLKHVYQQNAVGLRPTLTELSAGLGLSKPTTRKRVNALVHTGHLAMVTRGRTKVLEMTEKGRRVFLK